VYLSGLALQNVLPNSAPPAPAPGPAGAPGIAVAPAGPGPAAPAAQGQSPFFTLAMVLMFVPILFLMFRRNKKEQQAREGLKKGDRIASTSGLVGELIEMDARFAKVKLGPGNTVTMLTSSLQPLDATPAAKVDDKDLKDLKEAKAGADKK
jgi:preprotein translocase subunit YajC